MAKIRKFRAGDTVVDTSDPQEAKDKAAGLAASNAEKKSSGFLGLGRLFQGNIDEKGSEAYNKYGAGYGREVQAENDRLKAATLKNTAAPVRIHKTADPAAQPVVKPFGSGPPDEKLLGGKPMTINTFDGDMPRTRPDSTTPEKGDRGARDTSSFKKTAAPSGSTGSAASGSGSTGSTSGSDYRGPMERRKLSVSEPASGSGGGRGPSHAQVEAEKQKGFTASPMSTDQAQRAAATAARAAAAAKAAADAAAAAKPARNDAEKDEGVDVRPASQAQLKALAAIARATGSTSGVASGRITAAEAARKIAEYAKKIGGTASSFAGKLEFSGERRSRLAKEAKDKETASFNRERGDRATGGVIKSYAKGGSVSASSRGDGIAQRGKTRGRMC